MPWVTGAEYQRLLGLEEQVPGLHAQVSELQRQLATARVVGAAALEVERAVQDYQTSGVATEVAGAMAVATVVNAEKDRLAADLRDELLDKHRFQYEADYRREQGPTIRQQVNAELRQGGAYDDIQREVEADVSAGIRAELLEEERARQTTALEDDPVRATLIARIREELADSPEMRSLRETTRTGLEAGWSTEVHEEVVAEIEAEERAREAAFKSGYAEQYRATPAMTQHRNRVRAGHEKDWKGETEAKVAGAIGDEELQGLLHTKAQQAKEKLAKETRAAELLADFETTGIDLDELQTGDTISLYLGELSQFKKEDKDLYGRVTNTTMQTGVEYARKLILVSKGAGRFVVRHDSLAEHGNLWAREAALKGGVIVTLGNCIQENGQERLESHVAAGMMLHYDDDTTTPDIFHSLSMPVANVEINGVAARQLDFMRLAKD